MRSCKAILWDCGTRSRAVSPPGRAAPGANAGFQASTHSVGAILGYTGLKTGGDVIVAIDGRPVRSADDVVRIVTYALRPGAVATFTVVRGRERRQLAVMLGHRPSG